MYSSDSQSTIDVLMDGILARILGDTGQVLARVDFGGGLLHVRDEVLRHPAYCNPSDPPNNKAQVKKRGFLIRSYRYIFEYIP